jgi:hypothetical protein
LRIEFARQVSAEELERLSPLFPANPALLREMVATSSRDRRYV